MTTYKYYEASPHDVRIRALWPLVIAAMCVGLSFFLPPADGGSLANGFEGLAGAAIILSNSAKVTGVTIITLIFVLILGTRKRLSAQYRLKEAIAVAGTIIVFAGGGALLNEHIIKPKFDSPRPNVVWLSTNPVASGAGFSVETYYASTDAVDRTRLMIKAVSAIEAELPRNIGLHWATEPGYSFPSGHAYASFFVATFFLLFATSFVATNRQTLFYLLVPWAVMVSFSRIFLNEHRSLDVMAGAFQGLVIGILAWMCIRLIVRKLGQVEIGS